MAGENLHVDEDDAEGPDVCGLCFVRGCAVVPALYPRSEYEKERVNICSNRSSYTEHCHSPYRRTQHRW